MRTLNTVLTTLVVTILALGLVLAGIIYSGIYNVAASDQHWPITHWALKQTIMHSVSRRADTIEAPELGGKEQLLIGAANFDAMCSGCHTPPGARPTAMAQGMYPAPPDLSHSGKEMPASKIFWTIKHGVKASGMPAWGKTHEDDEMWAMTALIKQFPEMTPSDYRELVQTAEAKGIGHHHDDDDHHGGGEHHHEEHGHDEGHGHSDSHHDDAAHAQG